MLRGRDYEDFRSDGIGRAIGSEKVGRGEEVGGGGEFGWLPTGGIVMVQCTFSTFVTTHVPIIRHLSLFSRFISDVTIYDK